MAPTSTLERQLIAEPRIWRLYLMAGSDVIDVFLYNITDSNGLMTHRIELDASVTDPVRRLEEAIYQNPLLLADFNRVSVLVDIPTYMAVPGEVAADAELLDKAVSAQWADGAELEALSYELPGQNASLVVGIDPKVAGFLRRTFNNPTIQHRLAPLSRYFLDKSRVGGAGKMYAHLGGERMDLMVFGRNSLKMLNTFKVRQPIDAVYYIMNARQSLDLDNSANELILSGDSAARDAVTPILRQYIASVMPAIYPSSMFRSEAGGKLDAPFELTVMPLCE